MAGPSTVTKNFRDGSITLLDGTAITPLDFTLAFESGDFSCSGLNTAPSGSYDYNVYLDRGDLTATPGGQIRKTNRSFVTGSFSVMLRQFTAAGSDETLMDMIFGTGAFSAAVSTLGANADADTRDVKLTINGVALGDASNHVLTLSDCLITVDSIEEGDPDKISCSFQAWGGAVFT